MKSTDSIIVYVNSVSSTKVVFHDTVSMWFSRDICLDIWSLKEPKKVATENVRNWISSLNKDKLSALENLHMAMHVRVSRLLVNALFSSFFRTFISLLRWRCAILSSALRLQCALSLLFSFFATIKQTISKRDSLELCVKQSHKMPPSKISKASFVSYIIETVES